MKLFISYSRDDAGNFANHIHKFMKNKGHDVFIDVNSITIGDPWARSIEKNISECDIFVVILTPDALSSSYVEKEVLQAQKQDKTIVPCIHQYVDYNEIKWGLEENQGIEFSDKYELALNLYPKIKNYKQTVQEKQNNISQQENIRNTIISEDANALINKGIPLGNQGKYQEAIELFDKALRIDPKNVAALYNKGFAISSLGKYEEAIEWYDKALRVDPNYKNALGNKGYYLIELGKDQEAIEWIDKALSVDPNDIDFLNYKGLALRNLGKYEEAIEYYDKALRIDPNYKYILNGKGTALRNLGKYEEAIEYYDKALRIDANYTLAEDNKKLALEQLAKEKDTSSYDPRSKGTMPAGWKTK